MSGEVPGHRIDTVGQILPRACNTGHVSLTGEFAFSADLTRHSSHFSRERTELIDHGIDRVLELENLTLNVHGDFLGEISPRHCGGDFGDVANLTREIPCHEIDRISQVFPSSRNAFHPRLTAKNSFRTDFARHPRHFRGKGT